MALRIFSYGGGVQSTAALVLAAQGKIDFPIFLFADTGDESKATYAYLHDHALPYAEKHAIALHVIRRTKRDGTTPTLREHVIASKRSVDIPVRMANGAPGNRNCTELYKIRVIGRWLREHGATKDDPAIVAVGISVDEMHRSRTDSGIPYTRRMEPLIDLRLSRQDCINLIQRAGLPVPPKSACVYCPFRTLAQWRRQLRDEPAVFAENVAFERDINAKRVAIGRDAVFLTSALIPLDMAVVDVGQTELDFTGLDMCESGYCMT